MAGSSRFPSRFSCTPWDVRKRRENPRSRSKLSSIRVRPEGEYPRSRAAAVMLPCSTAWSSAWYFSVSISILPFFYP